MIVPLVIGALWLAAAGLYALGQGWILAGVAAGLSPLALLLTVYLRRCKVALAARTFLAEQAARGVPPVEARARVAELAPEGVTVDTDDLPGWPFPVILLSGLLAIAALISALVRLL